MAEDEEHHHNKKQKKLTPTTSPSKIATVATKFLLHDAQHGFKNGNFVCSPISLEILLGMLAAGAEGKTLKQLLGFLGNETLDQFHSKSRSSNVLDKILSNLHDDREGLDICLANAIWVDKKLPMIQSCYKEILRTVYRTEAKLVDLNDKPDQAAKEINSWINKKTNGLIPTIVAEEDLKDEAILLANAVYFNGFWSNPFSKYMTTDNDFHLINGKTVSVPFMTSYKQFNYGSVKDFKILQIPYKSEGQSYQFSMYIFLPDSKGGLGDLLQVFHSNPAQFHEKFDLDPLYLYKIKIPKFKISCKFDPQDVMKQMGLTLPFNPMNMELRRIVEPGCPVGDTLYVSNVLQQSVIKVDETGTEATSLSNITLRGGGPAECPRYFVADHPFMFMIREETSLAVLFTGVVLNPLAE
uniref:serpin-Z10-like n=1 Tax=Erigeron canadensis TaxID=72917 RepID=UPI001CB8E9E6|nr:serpin-Z10-like [Erigeron canadensis]